MLGSWGSLRKDRFLPVSQSLKNMINAGLGSQDVVDVLISAGIELVNRVMEPMMICGRISQSAVSLS